MERDGFNLLGGSLAAAFCVVSLVLGILFQIQLITQSWVGGVTLAIWALGPPIFFWCDWVFFLPADAADREVAKHTHDLSRNIWLGLIGILAVLFNVKFSGG